MSLTRLVRPEDPVVTALLGGLPVGAAAAEVIRAIEDEVAYWAIDPRPGPERDYTAVAAARAANCINFATIVCACLRRSGVRDAYVLMGSLFGSFPVGAHTWVVYGDGTDGRAYLMNPPSLRAEPLTARWVRSVDPVAAWNDQDVAVGRSVLPMLVAELKLEETA